jgi:hypothetical protein
MKASMIAVFLALLAAATGCEDSPVAIGKDFKMYLLANPSSVDVDPQNPPDPPPTSTIIATVVNDTGLPQKGVNVFFSTTAGTLASSSQPVTTDGNGNAYDVLTIDVLGPAETTVTATATSLTQTVKITKTGGICSTNTAPVARITPATTQTLPAGAVGTTVDTAELSGLTSSDTGGTISNYSWTCFDGDTPIVGATVTCTYTYATLAKIYVVKLVVTDDGLAGHPECAVSSAPASITVNVPAGTVAGSLAAR